MHRSMVAASSAARAFLTWLLLQLSSALRVHPSEGQLAVLPPVDDLPIEQRRYFYLVEGPTIPPAWLVELSNRPECDAIFLAYRPELVKEDTGKVRLIEGRNTTWTTGRNMLYQEALRTQKQQGWRHEFLIFADVDTGLRPELVDTYHRRLTALQPAVAGIGKRNTCDDWPCGGDVDANFNAYHATAAPLFLPYDAHFDDKSWWASQAVQISLLMAAAPDYVVEFKDLKPFVSANTHRRYPRGFNGFRGAFYKYLRAKVSPCLQEKLDGVRSYMKVGGWARSCRKECPITAACRNNTFCEGGPETPLRDYGKLLECKPF